jgi:ACS family hexuronate transporter-like MFS transporter
VDDARRLVFVGCAVLTLLTIPAACLPKGGTMLVLLLLVGAGALGVFPLFHAFTQEISARHQGKVTGITGVAAWLFSSPAQVFFGRWVDRTGSFNLGVALAGVLPFLAALALLWGWNRRPPSACTPAPAALTPS